MLLGFMVVYVVAIFISKEFSRDGSISFRFLEGVLVGRGGV